MTRTVSFADLESLEGTDLGVSRFRTVTQDDIDRFAEVTGDHQWIHVDRERALNGPFGAPIAHGFLTLALLASFWSELLCVEDAPVQVNYGLDRVRFPAPVRVGSLMRLRAQITEVRVVASGFRLRVDQTIEISAEPKPAVVATSLYDIHRPETTDE